MTNPNNRALLITALDLEYDAVRAHLHDLRRVAHPQGAQYHRGGFAGWDVLLVEAGVGNVNANSETMRALEHFKPQVALFIGIAGGLKDVAHGDVVISSKVYGYESGKAEEEFRPRPQLGIPAYRLHELARSERREIEWQKRITPAPATPPKAVLGAIAAGEKVLASMQAPEVQFIKKQYGDTLAVEMEAYGFLEAVRRFQGIEALVVRGISDLVGDKTGDRDIQWQPIAARHAAAFAFEILAKLSHQRGHHESP